MTAPVDLPPLPRRPIPTVRRSSLEQTLARYRSLPEVDRVEVVAAPEEVARLIVHWESGRRTELIITEDV